jgi:lysophospholipase L1-like esterase
MKQKTFALLLMIALALCLGLACTPAVTATVKIMPLGDSLTKGLTDTTEAASHPTYRYWLWNELKSKGYDVDFVGSWTDPNFDVNFDQDNEGHGGYTTSGILDGVEGDAQGRLADWLTGYTPDIALVMLGTNDVLNNVPTQHSIYSLGRIIDTIRQKNPNVRILLAQIPSTSIPRDNLLALNAAIPGLAAQKSTAQSPVTVVDMYTGFDGVADTQDGGVHPDASGEHKIAAKWYAALAPMVPVSPTSTPTPVPTPVPTQIPTQIQTPTTQYQSPTFVQGKTLATNFQPGTAVVSTPQVLPSSAPTASSPILSAGLTNAAPVQTAVASVFAAQGVNVIQSPGATVYAGEIGLNIVNTGVQNGYTLGCFNTGVDPQTGSPAQVMIVNDVTDFAVHPSAYPGIWYSLNTTPKTPVFTVAVPSLALTVRDVTANRPVQGDTVLKGRHLSFELTSNLEGFLSRQVGAQVAVKIKSPTGSVFTSVIDTQGVTTPLDPLTITSNTFRVTGTGIDGAAWDTGNSLYEPGEYQIWAETELDYHHHAYWSPEGIDTIGKTITTPLKITLTPLDGSTLVPAGTVDAGAAAQTIASVASTTAVPVTSQTKNPIITTNATTIQPVQSQQPVAGGATGADQKQPWTSYLIYPLLAVFLIAAAGILYQARGKPDQRGRPRSPQHGVTREVRPSGLVIGEGVSLSPRTLIVLDKVAAYDPQTGSVGTLAALLHQVEQDEWMQSRNPDFRLTQILNLSSVPSLPVPDSIARWAEGIGYKVIAVDRRGDVLFYTRFIQQGESYLRVMTMDELVERIQHPTSPAEQTKGQTEEQAEDPSDESSLHYRDWL